MNDIVKGTSITGELRRLPAPLGIRIFQALSLWLFIAGFGRLVLRYLLGSRCRVRIEGQGGQLRLAITRSFWGRRLSASQTLLPLRQLQEITLEEKGESPHFFVGLAALALGSFVGARLMSEGISAAGGAPTLVLGGLSFFLMGLALDFFMGSGRRPSAPTASAQLLLKVQSQRGWVVSGLNLAQAQQVISQVQLHLQEGIPLNLGLEESQSDEFSGSALNSPGAQPKG